MHSTPPGLRAAPRSRWPWAWVVAFLAVLMAGPAAAVTLDRSALSIQTGTYGVVKITGARGTISATVSDPSTATVTLTDVTRTGATLNVVGRNVGSTSVRVRDRDSRATLSVTVAASSAMSVAPTSLSMGVGASATLTASRASGTVTASAANTAIATVSVNANVVTVRGLSAGATVVAVKDGRTTVSVPVTVTGAVAAAGRYSLIAWNDLGMHCVDGRDYSVFSILPPFNNLHAQLVNASTGKVVTSGVSLTYEAVADPTGSINTTSVGKTNFWSWSRPLYGASPAPDVGLTGYATPSRTARAMALDTTNGWFEATGVPIMPYDDTGAKNFYPTVKVTARDATGKVLATTTTVLPVSDEMTCAACHSSRPASEANTARIAARPAAGWVNDSNAETDWKKNILRLHDEKQASNPTFVAALAAKGLNTGLLASALAGTPSLCASCHASNALPGTGLAGVSALTSALHTNHGKAIDPTTMLSLESSTNRNACYMCHPGSVTKCLRGAMGNAVDAAGNAEMGCQNCHGSMSKVGHPARVGWLQEPDCQSCHHDGKRALTALDAAGNLVKPADARYATNANVPAAGFSLFRFSKGHGGLQCEACHGATHAEYPSSHANDNLQSIALQGYAGTIRECTVCHATVPMTTAGGPHGMHTIGANWVKQHGDRVESSGSAACAYCHGGDYRGSPMSRVKVARSYATKHGTRSFAAGQAVGCYDCHNGPKP